MLGTVTTHAEGWEGAGAGACVGAGGAAALSPLPGG